MVDSFAWPPIKTPIRIVPMPRVSEQISQSFWDQRPVQVNPLGGEHWRFRAEFMNCFHDDALKILGYFLRSNGREFPIRLPLAFYRRKLGTQGAGWAINGSVAAGVGTLPLTGGSGAFAVGDIVVKTHNGDPFAYMVTVAGGSSIGIWPRFQWPTNGGSIQYLGDGSSTILHTAVEITSDLDMVFEVLQQDSYAHEFFVEFQQSSASRFA